MNYGVTDALAPFPLHSLVNVMSATINNNTVCFNVQETLPLLLRMVDPEEFAQYDSMTPTALDYLADHDDAVNPMPFILKQVRQKALLYILPQMSKANHMQLKDESTAIDNRPGGRTPITS